jgi:hypothetical protein
MKSRGARFMLLRFWNVPIAIGVGKFNWNLDISFGTAGSAARFDGTQELTGNTVR